MRILLCYPGPRHSTFDVAAGWDEALRELGHEVFSFRFDFCIDFCLAAKEAWEKKHVGNPGAVFNMEDWQKIASEQVVIAAADFQPDVALIVSGMQYHPRAFHILGKMGIPKAVILTESPYQDERQALMLDKGEVDLAFTNDKESLGPLSEFCPVEYLPHSYDPSRHYPGKVNGDYASDVFFCGTLWPDRRTLITPLKERWDIDVCVIGPKHWRGGPGLLPNAELAEYYRGTRIALNHHREWRGDIDKDEGMIETDAAWSINPRAFEIAACGAFQLSDGKRPELAETFGDSVATYKDGSDMQAKVDYFLAHDAERTAMALEAKWRIRNCRFVDRAEQIVLPAIAKHL